MTVGITSSILMILFPCLPFGQTIQKSQQASQRDCTNGGQTVAACFRVSATVSEPAMEETACTESPVIMTGMKSRGDGSFWVSFRNLDKERRVTAVSYLVTVFDDQNRRIVKAALWGRPLSKPVEPGAEMEFENEEPHIQLGHLTPGRYLVQFNSVLFTNMSEWQMRTRCFLSKESGFIVCSAE